MLLKSGMEVLGGHGVQKLLRRNGIGMADGHGLCLQIHIDFGNPFHLGKGGADGLLAMGTHHVGDSKNCFHKFNLLFGFYFG